jgi:hypothetical protein
MSPRPFNALLEAPFTYGSSSKPLPATHPAHPYVADALCAVGRVVADTAEPAVDALVDPRVEITAITAFAVGCWLFAYVAPHLAAFGWLVTP